MSKYRVKAFTLLEVTIAMLIAAIVIGIAYTAFSIVHKTYSAYHTKNNEMATVLRLNELLKKDFKRAGIVLKDTNGLVLKDTSNLVRYRFEEAYVIRIAGIIDTFKLQTETITVGFEGVPVDVVSDTEEQNRVDDLIFNLLFRDEKIPYHYHKQYSSADLIQRNPNAIN